MAEPIKTSANEIPANTVVLATSNPGKIIEFNELAGAIPFQLIVQGELGVPDADETAISFVGNALLKAYNAAAHTGMAAISEDSGLVVDALDGAPGVFSKRYAGPNATQAQLIGKLLTDLEHVPIEQRTARFVAIAVYVEHASDPLPVIGQGSWEGAIATTAAGDDGFGYDPIFVPAGQTQTSAELGRGFKIGRSHRALAVASLLTQLSHSSEARAAKLK